MEASERPCQAEEIAGVTAPRSVRGPDQLSGEGGRRGSERGPVATSEDLALCSAGGALGGLELFWGFQKVSLWLLH